MEEHVDQKTIVKQIKNTIRTMYRSHYAHAPETDFNYIVTYNPVSRTITFKHLTQTQYLIVAFSNESIFSMCGQGPRVTTITTSSNRSIDVLPVETENSA